MGSVPRPDNRFDVWQPSQPDVEPARAGRMTSLSCSMHSLDSVPGQSDHLDDVSTPPKSPGSEIERRILEGYPQIYGILNYPRRYTRALLTTPPIRHAPRVGRFVPGHAEGLMILQEGEGDGVRYSSYPLSPLALIKVAQDVVLGYVT